jgi:outer membrane protein assembly factor BamB
MQKKTHRYQVDGVGGVAFDGDALWISTFTRPDQFRLLRVLRETGEVRRELQASRLVTGIAWDGSHLWAASEAGIDCLDPETGTVVRTLPLPDEWFISGLAWDGEFLWVGAHDKRRIHKVDPDTGKVLQTIQSDRLVTGITWVGRELWHAVAPEEVESAVEIRKLDSESGLVMERVPIEHLISGLAFDGTRFWSGDCRAALVRGFAKAEGVAV